MSADRRRALRVACDLEVLWRRRGIQIPVRAIDISPKGMLLLTEEPVMAPFTMDLAIYLPDGVIEVLAQIRFAGMTAQGPGAGVSLLSMTTEENDRWCAYYRTAVAVAARPRPPRTSVRFAALSEEWALG